MARAPPRRRRARFRSTRAPWLPRAGEAAIALPVGPSGDPFHELAELRRRHRATTDAAVDADSDGQRDVRRRERTYRRLLGAGRRADGSRRGGRDVRADRRLRPAAARSGARAADRPGGKGRRPLRQGRARDRALDAERAAAPGQPCRDDDAADLARAPLPRRRGAGHEDPAGSLGADDARARARTLERARAGAASVADRALPARGATERLRAAGEQIRELPAGEHGRPRQDRGGRRRPPAAARDRRTRPGSPDHHRHRRVERRGDAGDRPGGQRDRPAGQPAAEHARRRRRLGRVRRRRRPGADGRAALRPEPFLADPQAGLRPRGRDARPALRRAADGRDRRWPSSSAPPGRCCSARRASAATGSRFRCSSSGAWSTAPTR